MPFGDLCLLACFVWVFAFASQLHPICARVAWSFLVYSLLGNDRKQRLSPGLVTQVAAKFGIMRSHTNATVTSTESWKGTLRECTPHTVCHKKMLHCRNPSTTNDRSGWRYRPLLYTRYLFLTELSSNIIPKTPRNLQHLLDISGLFRILLDRSPAQRSSPNGLIGICAGDWFTLCSGPRPKAHWYMHRFSLTYNIITARSYTLYCCVFSWRNLASRQSKAVLRFSKIPKK